MSNYSNQFQLIKNNFNSEYTGMMYINDLTDYINERKESFDCFNYKRYLFNFFEHKITSNDNSKLKNHVIIKIVEDAFANAEGYTSQTDDQLFEEFSDLFSLLYQHNSLFLSPLIEFVRRADFDYYKNFKEILTYVLLDYDEINKYISDIYHSSFLEIQKDSKTKSLIGEKLYHDYFIEMNDSQLSEFSNIFLCIYCFFSIDFINNYFNVKEQLNRDEILLNDFFKPYYNLKKSFADILIKRQKYPNSKHLTLEEIGQEYNVTRERIRQIAVKAELILQGRYHSLCSRTKKEVLTDLYYSIKSSSGFPYINEDELYNTLLNSFHEENQAKFVLTIFKLNLSSNVVFDSDLSIAYDKNIFNPKEFINELKNQYRFIIRDEEYENISDPFQKLIIDRNYRYRYGVHALIGINKVELFNMAIEKYFPDGIDVKQDHITDDVNKLLTILKEQYGYDDNDTIRSIDGVLGRCDVMAIDRSRIKSKIYCVDLDDDLYEDILNYINNNGPIVAYDSVFEVFKNQLCSLGINNKYYLKSLLDIRLDKSIYHTKRDYINCSGTDETFYDAAQKAITSLGKSFTIKDIEKVLPGIAYSVIYTIITSMKSIVHMGLDTYYNFDFINISDDDKKEMHDLLANLFIKLNTSNIYAEKLFNEVLLNHYSLFKKYPDFDNSYTLFSLFKYYFKDEFCFQRPMIAKNKDELTYMYDIPSSYAKKQEWFDHKKMFDYMSKMNMPDIDNYSQFLIDMSEDFIQVSMDKMIRKDVFGLTRQIIDKIYNELNFYINNYGEIDTRTYKAYALLPKLTYSWNKYLLQGIVRTYMRTLFEVSNTDSRYVTTDYIIRRVK